VLSFGNVSRADTLVEVLFAVTVFSLVAVGALTLMNQGTSISQRSLETTLVRQEIDAQAETLRFLHDSYVAAYREGQSSEVSGTPDTPFEQWQAMLESIIETDAASASDFGASVAACPDPPSSSFVLDSRSAAFVAPSEDILGEADTYAKLEYDDGGVLDSSKGLWIEAIRSDTNTSDPYQSNIGFIDFHIRACWFGPGQGVPLTIGTIVRLYEPR
jgi:type II secretory pathway pseudopilin PulG